MLRSHRIVISLLLSLFLGLSLKVSQVAAATEDTSELAQVRQFPTHSRIIFKIDSTVPTDLKNTKTGFELRLRGISLLDLNLSSEEVESLKTKLHRLNDPRLAQVDFKEDASGILVLGRWKFPTGKAALADPEMEHFDYRTQSPPRYVIDFWLKKGPTLIEVETKRKQELYLDERKKVQELSKQRQARRVASQKQETNYLNSLRVCEIPLSEKNDLFLGFNTIHQKVDFSRWISTTTPDSNFAYYRTQKKTRDAKYVRLALDLYKQGRWGLVVRTLDFLVKEYPKSDYFKEMKFLRANAYLRMGLERQAVDILEQIIADYEKDEKGSTVALYSAMFLAGKFLNKHLNLKALENFLWLIQNYSDFADAWVFHLGAAESLYDLKQTDRAQQEYQWVVDHAPTDAAKAEAAFRAGDLYMVRYEYEQALAVYSQALRDLRKESHSFPAFFLNRGEALYQLGQYETAKQVFYEAIGKFAVYPETWRATFRLGEIIAKDTVEPEKIKESREWFYDTINHYPLSPGATLARIRLVPCGDHAGMDATSSEEFFNNTAMEFNGGGDVIMTHYNDFRALAHIRSLVTLGPEELIGKTAFRELRNVKNPLARKKIILVATESVQRKIMKLISEEKHFEALSYYTLMSPLIVKDVESQRVDYLLALSQSAAQLGFGTFAAKLSKIYKEKFMDIRRRSLETNNLQSEMPDDLAVELRHVEEDFADVKSIWLSDNKSADKIATLKEKLEKVPDESKFSYQKEIILGSIEERLGNLKAALSHVAKARLQNPSLRVTAWLTQLTLKADDLKDALVLLKDLESHCLKFKNFSAPDEPLERALGVPAVPSISLIFTQEGEVLEKMDLWEEASKLYLRASDHKIGGNRMKYQYARALIKLGSPSDKEKAREIFEKLAESDSKDELDRFWKQMAQAKLADDKFN